MGSYEQKLSGTSIASGGSTSFTIGVDGYNQISLQVEGDSNSTDIDISTLSKAAPSAVLTDDELTDRTAIDLTTQTGTADLKTYDVKSYKTVEITIGNDAANSTVVDAYVGYGEHQ